jgi:hypothetical protein
MAFPALRHQLNGVVAGIAQMYGKRFFTYNTLEY